MHLPPDFAAYPLSGIQRAKFAVDLQRQARQFCLYTHTPYPDCLKLGRSDVNDFLDGEDFKNYMKAESQKTKLQSTQIERQNTMIKQLNALLKR